MARALRRVVYFAPQGFPRLMTPLYGGYRISSHFSSATHQSSSVTSGDVRPIETLISRQFQPFTEGDAMDEPRVENGPSPGSGARRLSPHRPQGRPARDIDLRHRLETMTFV